MLDYPLTRKTSTVDTYHGVTVVDPFRWLEETDSPETLAWIEAQNKLTLAHLEQIGDREEIRRRMSDLWDHERYGTGAHPVPFTAANRVFFLRNDGLQNQAVLFVQEGLDGRPRILLDPNQLSADGSVALATMDVTPDGRFLAYGVTEAGSDWQGIRVRDVDSGVDLPDRIRWVKFSSPSWTHDNGGFFYARYPKPAAGEHLRQANLGHQLYYHRLGTEPEDDPLVYERPDQPEWGFGATVTEDGRYALIQVWHGTAPENRLYYLDLKTPSSPNVTAQVRPLLDDGHAAYHPIGNDGTRLFLLTNRLASRKRVVTLDLANGGPDRLNELIPEGPDVLESASLLGDRLVLVYLRNATAAIVVHDLGGRALKEVELPTLGSITGISGQQDRGDIFFAFTSFLHPTTAYRHDLDSGTTEPFAQPVVDFDPSQFQTVQKFYATKDGTRIPIFLVGRRDLARDQSTPVMLYGYGGFNVSLTPFFSVPNIAWIERGGLLAVPNLRGGGEFGEAWHLAGTQERKQNVFDDFIAAAEYLIAERHARKGRIAISGASNGGLLVAASMIQRPDLFGAALPSVGVLDMLRFHRFTIGWAWVSDYGSSDNSSDFEYLRAYSPLHNVEDDACYPATLVTTADHDDRVVPGHSFKFAARLQEAQGCSKPTLIRIDVQAGHGAGSPINKVIEEATDRMAFAWWHVTR